VCVSVCVYYERSSQFEFTTTFDTKNAAVCVWVYVRVCARACACVCACVSLLVRLFLHVCL